MIVLGTNRLILYSKFSLEVPEAHNWAPGSTRNMRAPALNNTETILFILERLT